MGGSDRPIRPPGVKVASRPIVRRRLGIDSGFSLPEVLVAAGLLLSALTALAPLLVLAIRADVSSRLRTLAVFAAGQKQEELLGALSHGTAIASTSGVDSIDAMGHAVDGEVPGRSFLRRWWIEPSPTHPADAAVVRVEVTSVAAPGGQPIVVHLAVMRRHPR